jgi:O-antigen/teichoic acid export membrane protein
MPIIGLGFLPRVVAAGYSVIALVRDRPQVTTLCLLAGAIVALPAYFLGIRYWGVVGAGCASLSVDIAILGVSAYTTRNLRKPRDLSG